MPRLATARQRPVTPVVRASFRRQRPASLILTIILLSIATDLAAQPVEPPSSQDAPFTYVIKVMCGRSNGTVVAPGTYWTAVNVHNATRQDTPFRKRLSVALPSEKPGPVSRFREARLQPSQSLEIDCPDMRGFNPGPAKEPFFKGFILIESQIELDVVVVYTAADRTRLVRSVDVEYVRGRHRP